VRVVHSIDSTVIDEEERAGRFLWIDLQDPSDAELSELQRRFAFAELAIEDTREFRQRPKLDDYADHVLLVFYGIHEHALAEVHIYVTAAAIVTVHRGPCSPLRDAEDRLARRPPGSSEEAVYRVLDALTDSFFPEVRGLDDEVDQLEDAIVDGVRDHHRKTILELRRRTAALRRVIGPQRDLLAQGGSLIESLPGLDADEARDWFRDVYDHLLRLGDAIDSLREMLSAALDLYLSEQSTALTIHSERLTRVATIFLPLTFITGFFGMNFGWLVSHIESRWAFFGYGVGAQLLGTAIIYVVVRRSSRTDK
jgi:magnesium transporter